MISFNCKTGDKAVSRSETINRTGCQQKATAIKYNIYAMTSNRCGFWKCKNLNSKETLHFGESVKAEGSHLIRRRGKNRLRLSYTDMVLLQVFSIRRGGGTQVFSKSFSSV